MPDTKVEEAAARPASWFRRLAGARWPVAGAAVLLAVLALLGWLPAGAVAVVLAGIAAFAALAPSSRAPRSRPEAAARAAVAWPDTGMKLFAEALPDPCFILDLRGVVRYANRHAFAAFPVGPGEPLTHRLRVPDVLAAFDRVAKGGPPETVQFSERVPTERWFAAALARIDGGRHGSFVVVVLDDMTERRRSERVRVDFVANASHELRTPLASLAGFIDTLLGPARDDAAARERFLSIMKDQATRMSRLVDDLLSLSRIELKEHVKPAGTVNLAAVVGHVTDTLDPLARELGVAIETHLPPGPVTVRGESDELIQVFANLVENACKYGQSGGRVVVTVADGTADGGPGVTVRDFGPGIAEEDIPRLTERFYRVDVDASRRHRGTGLGLAIVKHILARHEALMTVDSRPGEGARFKVVFPRSSAAGEPAAPS